MRSKLTAIVGVVLGAASAASAQEDAALRGAREILRRAPLVDSHIEHAAKVAGVDHVGLGCDFAGLRAGTAPLTAGRSRLILGLP